MHGTSAGWMLRTAAMSFRTRDRRVLKMMTNSLASSCEPFHQYRDSTGQWLAHAASRPSMTTRAIVRAVSRSGAVTYAIACGIRRRAIRFRLLYFAIRVRNRNGFDGLLSGGPRVRDVTMPVVTMSETVAALRATEGKRGMPA